MAGIALCGAARAQVALHYRVIAQTGDTATGSGRVEGVPDRIFTFAANIHEFGAPVAAVGGAYAFKAAALFDAGSPAISIRVGDWGGANGSVSTLGTAGRPAPGTVGNFGANPGPLNVAPGGGVVFSSDWIKVSPTTASGAGYWLGDTGESSYPTLEAVPGGGLVVPLQNRD